MKKSRAERRQEIRDDERLAAPALNIGRTSDPVAYAAAGRVLARRERARRRESLKEQKS